MKVIQYLILWKSIFLAMFTLASIHGTSQAQDMIHAFNLDSVDQRDSKGRKHGWCSEYLTANWKHCRKKKKAAYCKYEFYYHGKYNVWTIYKGFHRIDFDMNKMDTTARPIILNGLIKFYDKKGNSKGENQYKDGVKVGLRKSYYKDGKIASEIDYDRKFENQFPSYYVKSYHKAGFKKFKGYYRLSERHGYMLFPD